MGKYKFAKVNHKVNKIIRDINKELEEDELWKGRFVLRQIEKQVFRYSDLSGWYLTYKYRIYDKKTGYIAEKWFDHYDICYGARLWYFVNDFITKKSEVWNEDPKPNINSPSYVGVPLPKILKRYEYWSCSWKNF